MKWITRDNAKVDRIACPWLIRRFVDPEAEFLYVPREEVLDRAKREGAIPYDVPGAELYHLEGRCSFESILVKYGLTEDPSLVAMGRIVHAADVAEDLGTAPEGAGLMAIAHGFSYLHGKNDHLKLDLEMPMYDALFAWCRQNVQAATG